MPRISVIIPNYNHSQFLEQRISSILDQTFQDFELIILDDCSTDDSRSQIEQYRNHPKVSHIVFNERNSGSPFLQWEKGIYLAQGEWIWIAESDDFCEKTLLENLTIAVDKNPNIGLAYVQSLFYYSETKNFQPAISQIKDEETIISREFVGTKLIPYNSLLNAGMAIFRKDLFYKTDPVYKEFKFAGDWIFWAEISRHCDVFVCGKFLNYFRMHPVKVTYNSKRTGLGNTEEVKVLNYFRDKEYISPHDYENALFKSYFSFRYQKFDYDDGVVQRIERLYRTSFSKDLTKRIDRKLFTDKWQRRVSERFNRLINIV